MNRKFLPILIVGLVALGVLFWLLKPASQAPDGQLPASGQTGSQSAQARVVNIKISDGLRSAGPEVVRVSRGESITLRFASDQDAELHLHGYDRHLQLKAGQPAELTLVAEHSGRFEYELHGQHHGAHQALGVIEVLPE